MPTVAALRRARGLGLRAAALLAFLPPLLTRLVMGQAFYQTGSGKLRNFDNTVAFFTDLGIPMPELNAAFVSRLELYGGLLLIVGLATRLLAAGLLSTMVVALMTADRDGFVQALRGTGEAGLTDVVPFVYLLFLLWLVIAGPGKLSLDALLERFLGSEPAPQPATA
ncbi:MAG: DoxX family protein [Candidatus Rokuibacteriota bacterium]